jgi:hypothetical protein
VKAGVNPLRLLAAVAAGWSRLSRWWLDLLLELARRL